MAEEVGLAEIVPVQEETEEVTLGRVTGVYGVRGWLRIRSYTDPVDGLLSYRQWVLCKDGRRQPVELVDGRSQGKGLIVSLEGYVDRDQAALLSGMDIRVPTQALPELDPGDYYWYQLEGLTVVNLEGQVYGVIDYMMETGANDVMVVKPVSGSGSIDARERLIPYLLDRVVKEVDLQSGQVVVDWDPEY